MRPKDLVFSQLEHRETHFIPYTLGIDDSVAEKLDIYYGSRRWRESILNHIIGIGLPDMKEETRVSDKLVKDVYGSTWRVDLKPKQMVEPAVGKPSFTGYEFPPPGKFLDEAKKVKALDFCRENKDVFLVANIGQGLFERSWSICGFENALMYSAAEQDFYDELLDRIFTLQSEMVAECVKLPVDGIMFGDDWGDQRGVILGPERWRKFFKSRLAMLYSQIHNSEKYVLSHCCGSVVDIMDDIIDIGLDVIQSVQPEARGMDPYKLKSKYGDKIVFWGGLGSQSIIPFGKPVQIASEVAKLCSEMGKGGGYIFSPAKALQPETPVENACAVVESIVKQKFSNAGFRH